MNESGYRVYGLPNGKRAFRATKLTDRKGAEEFCRRLDYCSNESRRDVSRKPGCTSYSPRSLSVSEFFAQRIHKNIRQLVADSPDTLPAMATQIGLAWEKIKREKF